MGSFSCRCGNTFRNTLVPCKFTGRLKWDPEIAHEIDSVDRDVKSFFESLENIKDKEWVKNYFGSQYAESYPEKITKANVIEDISSRYRYDYGNFIYRCDKCERIYIEKEYNFICYEKADD